MKLGEWLGFVCLVISLYILWHIRWILLLVFTAIVLATAMNSLARQVQKFGLKRNQAIPIAIAALLMGTTIFFVLIVPPFVAQFQKLLELLPIGFDRLLTYLDRMREQLPSDVIPIMPDLSNLLPEVPASIPTLFSNFFALFGNSLAALLQSLLVLVLAIMLLGNPQAYRSAFLRLVPSFYRRRVDGILCDCETDLGHWLAGILINSVFIFALSWIGLLILQVPLALAHALIAGLLNFIPNIGPTLSVIFPVTIALLDEPWKAIAVIILYVVIQQIESYWLTPTVMARQVSLLPAVTLSAQIFFASIFGFLGLLLALPLTVVAKVWIKEVLVRDILDQWHGPDQWREPQTSAPKANGILTTETILTSETMAAEKNPEEVDITAV
ncbi:MAG: AI-2E family transporter [Cyanothece sp. SIO1E1]|nr:AI-2E family transporter [Cyanothece sp. SIO1E1]